ncbi:hypothetical protein [Bradyrhizobium sp. CCBAU 45384]|uniref:hypothetical protein n=1 Tax=Bradyrhizobium sp. CCBAU 45384 TaxID=858428 RepID=UPI00230657FD|nr:hypothetical protein [Bradyrhizobium sp. CCBAU 45384]
MNRRDDVVALGALQKFKFGTSAADIAPQERLRDCQFIPCLHGDSLKETGGDER